MIGALILALASLATPQDPKAELQALKDQHAKELQEFWSAVRAERSPEERSKLFREKHPDKKFLPRFKELAKKAAGTETAAGVWVQVIRLSSHDAPAMADALERLIAEHIGSPALEEALPHFESGIHGDRAERLIRTAIEKSPHRAVQAGGRYTLATLLREAPEEKGIEARRLLEGLVKDFKETEYAKRAEADLFEIDHLEIGKTAPDFEATDQDGKTFKLSDYRGKVVVIDFWGFW
jgi:hypothetical protein